ncbi:hypothetical protein EGQ77_07605 [bacterium]|nr:hypothetical protein [bacterium]
MMINAVSGVRFRGAEQAATINPLERPGKYAKPETPPEAPTEKKSGSGGKTLAKTVVGLAVITGALVALPKVLPNIIKALPTEELANAGIMDKAAHYLAKAGEFIGKYTYEPIKNLIAKN